jgi:hypothetical protein
MFFYFYSRTTLSSKTRPNLVPLATMPYSFFISIYTLPLAVQHA